MAKDYSEYKLTEYDRYRVIRSNNRYVDLGYFENCVEFFEESRTLRIHVDGRNEFYQMQNLINKSPIERKRRSLNPSSERLTEDGEDMEQLRLSIEAENKKRVDLMRQKFNVNFTEAQAARSDYYDYHPSYPVEPFINIFSGATIDLRYGEGILDFIYADFQTPLHDEIQLYSFLNSLKEHSSDLGNESKSTTKIIDKAHAIVENFFDYITSFISVNEIAYSSLYSAICPPKFERCDKLKQEILWYGNYLIELQKEYIDLIKFCFDENYYPSVLGRLSPPERFRLYRSLRDHPDSFRRTEYLSFVDQYLDFNHLVGLNEETGSVDSQTYFDNVAKLAEEYGVSPDILYAHLLVPSLMKIQYQFNTIEDILCLEFTKMLESNLKFRKCKRCGKYFLMKGNYDTNYCDRVAQGETKNCQELAAVENYKAKIADNKAIPVYNKYYKRYAARMKVRQIKEADFKKWKYQALTMRDECSEGKITVEEYIQWMEDFFPNRKKKK